MKVTLDNLSELQKIFNFDDREKSLLKALLLDVDIFNKNPMKVAPIWIEIQDYHDTCDEYPDYYGYYRIFTKISDDPNDKESISLEMDINELDVALCTLTLYFDEIYNLLSNKKK